MRRTDEKARVTLFADFARAVVTLERVGQDEVRIRKVRKARRFTLAELVAGVTPENRHAEVKTGPAVGKEIG
jgi:antitoxin component of MazEF toxin-antitoxin module